MVDANLKSAVLQAPHADAATVVQSALSLDFARHHGFAIEACNVARGGNGRDRRGVRCGLCQKNFLHGLRVGRLPVLRPRIRLESGSTPSQTCASSSATQQRPVDLLAARRAHLGSLNPHPYDLAHTSTSVASSQFRITLGSNQYSRSRRICSPPIDRQSLSRPRLPPLLRQPNSSPVTRVAMVAMRTSRIRITPTRV